MDQKVQERIRILAQKLNDLSVQNLHSLSKEVSNQRNLQDYEENKTLDMEIKKNDINEFETPDKIDILVAQGTDIQSINWNKLVEAIHSDASKYRPIAQAVIYNGYDFSDNLNILNKNDVRHSINYCLAHPKEFKKPEMHVSIRALVRKNDKYYREELPKIQEQQRKEKELQRINAQKQRENDINYHLDDISDLSATKIDKLVKNGVDIQKINWHKLKYLFYMNNEKYKKVMRAIIYNGYDFSDAIPVFEHSKVQKEVAECMEHPKNFKMKGAYEKLQQFIKYREYAKEQQQIARDNDVNVFTNAEKINKISKKGIDIQQVDWDKVNQLKGAQYDKIVRAIIYNGFDFCKKDELLNNGKINALARDCLNHPDAFKVEGAYERLDKQMKAHKINKIVKIISTHRIVSH